MKAERVIEEIGIGMGGAAIEGGALERKDAWGRSLITIGACILAVSGTLWLKSLLRR